MLAQTFTDPVIEGYVQRARKNTNNSDSLLVIGNKTIAHAKKHTLQKGFLEGYFMLGYSEYLKGDFREAITNFEKGLEYDRDIPETHPITYRLLKNKAVALVRLGKPDSAQAIFKQVVTITKERDDPKNHALALSDYAIGVKNKGNYDKALDLYQQAMYIWDSLGVDRYKTSVLLNIGLLQNNLKNHKQSVRTYHQGLDLAKKHSIDRDIYRFYNNLAVNHNILKQHDSALYYGRKAAAFYKANNSSGAETLANQNIGKAFMYLNRQDSADVYFDKVEKEYKKSEAKARLGELFYLKSLNHHKKGENPIALAYSDSATTIFKKLTLVGNLKDTYEARAMVLEALGNFKEANKYIKAARKIGDEAYKIESVEKLNEIITKYEVEKKDEQIENLHNQKSFYISTSFLVGLISLVLFFIVIIFWVRNKKSKKELESLREQLENYSKVAAEENSPTLLHLKSKAVVNTKELLYIKSDGHYLEFYTQGNSNPEIDRNTLKEMNERLATEGFAQIHKSYLVNLDFIRIINSTKLMLEDGTWLPLSRTYKPRLKETLLHTSEKK
ncbi:LytTR family transcriptional regulator [Marinirhabdus gelatinilytica]|uniref:Tetratricopeptide repeat protein n=1 Tax=Marinirhabdus gelatinilytica TaxID=1703343 RepID=A0A370QFF8_9FLAO|nr:LytTR family transcriptional regulator [Marinirhabdus gelatinilytica]RDK87097.1 tetratricopeptide repeat protein [Marinirhabdus gelatinilytica]